MLLQFCPLLSHVDPIAYLPPVTRHTGPHASPATAKAPSSSTSSASALEGHDLVG